MKIKFLVLISLGLPLIANAEPPSLHGGGFGNGPRAATGTPTTGPCGVSIGAKASGDEGPTFGLRAKKTGCAIIIAPEKYEKVDDWYTAHKDTLTSQGWQDASDATVANVKDDLCRRVGKAAPECSSDNIKIGITGSGGVMINFTDGPSYSYHP